MEEWRDGPDDADDDASVAHAATEVSELDPDKMRLWWRSLNKALVECFGLARGEADEATALFDIRLRDRFQPGLVLAAYHLDPFQVAADLANAIRPVTPERMAGARLTYIAMMESPDRPAREIQSFVQADDPTLALRR